MLRLLNKVLPIRVWNGIPRELEGKNTRSVICSDSVREIPITIFFSRWRSVTCHRCSACFVVAILYRFAARNVNHNWYPLYYSVKTRVSNDFKGHSKIRTFEHRSTCMTSRINRSFLYASPWQEGKVRQHAAKSMQRWCRPLCVDQESVPSREIANC